MKTGMRICSNKGFQLSFKNGLTISVQFGPGNYCDNYNEPFLREPRTKGYESSDAEIAIFGTESGIWQTHKFLPKTRGHDVVGNVGTEELASLIRRVQQSKAKFTRIK